MDTLENLAHNIAGTGIRHIFGIPGSGASLTLLDFLEKYNVRFHLTHFEGSAALMAGTLGRLSGQAGVAISIKGPGLANMVPGLAACRLETLPVVSLSESYPPGTPASKAHKRMDHNALMSAIAKGIRFISKHGPAFSDLATWAEAEVPGPVHLDITDWIIERDDPVPSLQQGGDRGLDDGRIIEIVAKAQRPVVIAGTLASRKRWSSHLNRLSIPVFSVAAAKGVVDETLSHAAGVYTGIGLELTLEHSILPQADLVVALGLRHNEILVVKPFECKAINIDPLGDSLSSGFKFDQTMDSSPKQMEELFFRLSDKSWGVDALGRCLKRMRSKMLDGPFTPANVFEIIERYFQHQARLVLDTGNFCTIGEHILRVPKAGWYLSSGQGRYMGIGLPMALGAAIYDSDVPTVAFVGDGGIGMFIAEIKIAVKHRLPLVLILMSDSYFGSIRSRSIKEGLTQGPVTIYQPSWLKVMEGFGVKAFLANCNAKLEDALKSWNPSDGPLFVEIPFDPESYQMIVNHIR